jgi:hypothetical protein
MMEFWLSGSLSHKLFLFSRWNSGYQEAFHEFFYTVESRLSRSLFTIFSFTRWNFGYHGAPFTNFSFTWWNLGYHGAFSQFFLSHGEILAITEPFHEFFFHTVEFRLSRSLFTNFSFTRWNFGYHGAFSRTFLSHGGILRKNARYGGRLFSYKSQRVFT